MNKQIGQFLQYMRVERGASDHTLKSYREDLQSLAEYLADDQGGTPAPGNISTVELRGFVSALHEAGSAKSSIARRLASVRSFFEAWKKAQRGAAASHEMACARDAARGSSRFRGPT